MVINTLNEERNIAACIDSVRGFADEIVVCDMHSDDRTAELAVALGARVVHHERAGYVEPARRAAIEASTSEWVLVLDADERLTRPLAAKLREVAADGSSDLVLFGSLFNYFGGYVRHGGFFHTYWPRFFRRRAYLDTYSESDLGVHQNFRAIYERAKGRRTLGKDFYMLHEAYPTIEKYVCKTVGMYARVEGEQYHARGRRFSILRLVGEPVREFLGRFLLRGGFRDGVRGLILAVLFAAYRFTTWANVWLLEEQERAAAREPR